MTTTMEMATMPMMMKIPGMKPMMKTKTDMTMPVLEKTNEPTMTDDEIALWLITKGTMEDKPTMALAADRILRMRAERDEALECNEEFFVDNQILKKRVEETRKEWEGWQSASVKLMKQVTALTAERERLALAICGGEDAPGYANAQTVETLEHVAKQNQQSHGATINSLLAAEAERDRLREALEYILAECTLSDNTMPSVGAIKYAARAALRVFNGK